MKTSLYCYQDLKAKTTSDPFVSPNDETAKRNFLFGCFGAMLPPQDCILWKIGEFSVDDEDNSCFGLSLPSNGIKVISPTIEEIESYKALYDSYFTNKVEEFEA